MIPKIIHYCWFGKGEKPKLAKKCIDSWKKFCPDYKIMEWNEDNFDVNMIDYTRFTYNNKLYAYLSDYVRLWAVFNYGGVYFDTDVELIKSPDKLIMSHAYFGFESKDFINTGLGFGAEIGNIAVKRMLMKYNIITEANCIAEYTKYHCLTGSPKMNTYALTPFGLQQNGKKQYVCHADILPIDYLCPFDDVTGKMTITKNTVSIHWYSKSAQGKGAYIKSKIARPVRKVLKKFKQR